MEQHTPAEGRRATPPPSTLSSFPSSQTNRQLPNWEDKDLNPRVTTQRSCLADQPGARTVSVRLLFLIGLLDTPLHPLAHAVWAFPPGAGSPESRVPECLLSADGPPSFIAVLKHEDSPNTRYTPLSVRTPTRKKINKRHKANSGLLDSHWVKSH